MLTILNYFRKKYKVIVLITICVLYFLTIRGLPGNLYPNEQGRLKAVANVPPFESSLERGRFAQLISLAEESTFSVDKYKDFIRPDIAWFSGHYYPAFPPGVTIASLPLYVIGVMFGNNQLISYATTIFITLTTCYLVLLCCEELNLSKYISILVTLFLALGTNLWVYSVTLSAHPYSALLAITCLYLYIRIQKSDKKFKFLVILWFVYSFALFIDYPNLLTLAPFIFAANLTLLKVVDSEDALKFTFKSIGIYSIIGFLPVLVLYVLFSQSLFGRPIAFTNTYNLQRLQIQHIPFNEKHLSNSLFLKQSYSNRFQILRSIRGIEVLLVSRDRGLFFYSPLFILSILGVIKLIRRRSRLWLVICASFALNLIIYATFDDPWGGWSFGPRYLVASLPLLTVLVAIYLNSSYKKIL